jgi:hypothetical protein
MKYLPVDGYIFPALFARSVERGNHARRIRRQYRCVSFSVAIHSYFEWQCSGEHRKYPISRPSLCPTLQLANRIGPRSIGTIDPIPIVSSSSAV